MIFVQIETKIFATPNCFWRYILIYFVKENKGGTKQ